MKARRKRGQAFAAVCGKLGNGVWTVEIIPAEIKPPARSRAGASGIRVRFGTDDMTNMGDEANLVVAFNEQVLNGRINQNVYKPGTVILLESKWAQDQQEEVRQQYATALADLHSRGYDVRELGLEAACKDLVRDPRLGKNMFVLGMLCRIYSRGTERAFDEVQYLFGRKGPVVVESNQNLVKAGYEFAASELPDLHFEIPSNPSKQPEVVMNGNQAVGLGVLAAGIDVVSMYPDYAGHIGLPLPGFGGGKGRLLPASSGRRDRGDRICHRRLVRRQDCSDHHLRPPVSLSRPSSSASLSWPRFRWLSSSCSEVAPRPVCRPKSSKAICSPPCGARRAMHPRIVIAPATIGDCFHDIVTARKLAEAFRTPVLVLTDANLATGVTSFPRPAAE